MKSFILLGFRNVFRNKRRSFLAGLVLSLGLFCMVVTDGYIYGMTENMYATVTNGFISSGQIHSKDYELSFDVEKVIEDLPTVEKSLKEDESIQSYSKRVMTQGMISSAENSSNVQFVGIEPSKENKVSNIYKYLRDGRFVEEIDDVVLGKTLLEKLEIELGDKVILTFSEAHTGELVQALFRVTGTFSSGAREMDLSMVFVHIQKLQQLLNLNQGVHEIAIQFIERPGEGSAAWPIWEKLSGEKNVAKSWRVLAGDMVAMMEMTDVTKAIVAGILLILVALSIVNTLFMALYERLFEFGVLKAIGTSSRGFIIMIVSEAASLTFMSLIFGFILIVIFATPLYIWGIDYGGMEFASVTLREPVRYLPTIYQFTVYPIGIFLFSILVSLYPAMHVVRMTASQAMRRSM